MKNILLLASLFFIGISSMNAQQEELDIQQFKKEIEDKLSSFELDINSALKEMESAMGNMIFENDGNIIINGDTIIIAPGGELPDGMENFGELFRQIPETGGEGGAQFFFGGEDMEAFAEMFDQLKGQLDNAFDFRDFPMDGFMEDEVAPNDDEAPKQKKETPKKEEKKEKKRKTYSL